MKKYYCKISGQLIPPDRVEALKFLEVPESEWTLKEYSEVRRKQGIYSGLPGVSELFIVKKVGDTSLRQIFNGEDQTENEIIKDIAETSEEE